MFKNYLKTAIRNLGKNKFFSFINILGLSVGIAVSIMVSLYVVGELTVDRFNQHYENIYRIEVGDWFHVPAPLIPIIREEMPGLEAVAPTDRQSIKITYNENDYSINNTEFTEPDFLDIFTIEMISGDAKAALNEPYKLLLSEQEAGKIFGDENAVGKQVTVDNQYSFTIAGVFKDIPENSHLIINALSAFQNRKFMSGSEDFYDNWSNWNYQTYVRLADGKDPNETIALFNAAFNKIMEETNPDRSEIQFSLRHLRDIYFFNELNKNDFCKHGNMQYLQLFSMSALLTLIIAIINFINLSTARAGLRSKEIGIRKVNGARKSDLIRQFMGESIVVSAISFFIAVIFIELLLPHFNQIIGKELVFDFFNLHILLAVLAGIVFIAVLTGLYPAFFMSSFKTIFILKKTNITGRSGLRSRRLLMIFQFIITISLILGTLIIYSQMKFMVNKDLGYDKEHILYFWMDSDLKKHQETLKEKLLENSEIKKVAIAHSIPGNFIMEWGRNLQDGSNVTFFSVPCDEDYLNLLDLEIIEGRNFNPELESDKYCYIVNEAFLRKYDLKDPFSVTIEDGKIIGVVKDFTFQSLHYAVKPMAFVYFTDWSWMIAVKVSGNDIENAKEIIGKCCSEFSDTKVGVRFLDNEIEAKYANDKRFSLIFTILSVLAIIISSLGLLGLISFEANRRTKEIGIRKVLGATPLEIITLFNKELLLLLGISSVIAWIAGYYWLTNWLQNFAFRIQISGWYFILSGLIAAFFALFTFSFLAFKAANANPVKALKYE
ncbi:MAG: ABC transporter permease [Candidatus Cloacimonadales bacterium]|nr:ABC transporter permease [Candidatus Cloacimonadales bacterium]